MKKKALFIDRDGTLIKEPPVTLQVDTLEQLEFMPGVLRNLYRIKRDMEYELVMVTNQDGLGTATYPQENFEIVQDKMLQVFVGEGIVFDAIFVDDSFESDNKPTRKPGTGMLKGYLDGSYDLSESWVIGDRQTDIDLATNLGARGILFGEALKNTGSISLYDTAACWDDIYNILKSTQRKVSVERITDETSIKVSLNPDGTGNSCIQTGLHFFDHMLQQLAKHGNIDIEIQVKGDLWVDEHHTIEDTGIVLGQAFREALRDKRGMERYGFCLPMDDCLARVAIDFGGRSWLVWEADFHREKIGDMPTEMFSHFFKSFSESAACNLNIKAEGINEHHKIESIFKAFGRAIKMAVRRSEDNKQLPSTKGIL